MKKLIFTLAISFTSLTFAQVKPDKYESYLQSIQKELSQNGTQVNINNPNPFITGTALSNYYMNEQILLLEKDAFFMMKSNKLETTEQVADYQFRLKVLFNHANNILLQMVRAMQNSQKEGFQYVEAPKHRVQWEELLESCKKDPACVNAKLSSGEVSVQNELVDSFALSTQLFQNIPYMHAIEFASIYQLVQLLYMENLSGQSKIATVEFDLFIKKQKALVKQIDGNKQLTVKEKEFHRTAITNTVNKWKKKIAERKFDQKSQYKNMADRIKKDNQSLIGELDKLRKKNPEILPETEVCKRFLNFNKDRKRCELRAKLEEGIQRIRLNQSTFLNKKETKLPKEFFENI